MENIIIDVLDQYIDFKINFIHLESRGIETI